MPAWDCCRDSIKMKINSTIKDCFNMAHTQTHTVFAGVTMGCPLCSCLCGEGLLPSKVAPIKIPITTRRMPYKAPPVIVANGTHQSRYVLPGNLQWARWSKHHVEERDAVVVLVELAGAAHPPSTQKSQGLNRKCQHEQRPHAPIVAQKRTRSPISDTTNR